jgi:hypothetical protein
VSDCACHVVNVSAPEFNVIKPECHWLVSAISYLNWCCGVHLNKFGLKKGWLLTLFEPGFGLIRPHQYHIWTKGPNGRPGSANSLKRPGINELASWRGPKNK